MTNPYEVPLEELDAVRVPDELLVVEQPLRWAAAGAALCVGGDGLLGGDGDGD